LPEEVFPRVKYEEKFRGLCFLDPYGLHLNWSVLVEAAATRTIEIFLNFPILDINRNVVRDRPDQIDDSQLTRMDSFWGGREWLPLLYKSEYDLFGITSDARIAKAESVLVPAYKRKLKEAGFAHIPAPLAVRNSCGGLLYYLFFASRNEVGGKIANHLFRSHEKGGL
jgi:three-Cys-motif partner protein